MDSMTASTADHAMVEPTFLSAALRYKRALSETSSSAAFRQLWRDTDLPYRMNSPDPYSESYRDEVKAVYRGLTALEYEVGAELTSTKQDDAQFQLGYPWSSGDLNVIAVEMSKAIQALRAVHQEGPKGNVIEFGAGWGNLALPLAKAGMAVTTVDIDAGFNKRLQRLAAEQHTVIETFDGTFLDAARTIAGPFDTVIFQSSFHHCIDFEELLRDITGRLMAANGRILFLSEPVTRSLQFPWGIRYDGEALWAVMCNGWLELGFHEDFFLDLLFRHGLLTTRVPGVVGMVGDGWCATRSEHGLPFARMLLPAGYDAGFHPSGIETDWGRFCRGTAQLPGAGTASCTLDIQNFSPKPMNVRFTAGEHVEALVLAPNARQEVVIPTGGHDIDIASDVFIPNELLGNGDTREISFSLIKASWRKAPTSVQ